MLLYNAFPVKGWVTVLYQVRLNGWVKVREVSVGFYVLSLNYLLLFPHDFDSCAPTVHFSSEPTSILAFL
jgi:hypothetical protein